MLRQPFTLALIATSLLGLPPLLAATPQGSVLVAQSVWQRFTSSEGRFSVLFPGEPEQSQQPLNDGTSSESTLYIFRVERSQELVVYLVAYLDIALPSEGASANLKETALDSGQQGFLKGSGATLVSASKTSLGGHPGKDFKFQKAGSFVGRARFFLVENRLYQIVAIADVKTERSLEKSIDGFIKSFQPLAQ
jgi:hypothetical protein